MPFCQNCDSHVSHDYQRVFSVDGEVDLCPQCPDKTRESVDTETVSPGQDGERLGSEDLSNQEEPDWLQSMLSDDEEKQTTEGRTQRSALVW